MDAYRVANDEELRVNGQVESIKKEVERFRANTLKRHAVDTASVGGKVFREGCLLEQIKIDLGSFSELKRALLRAHSLHHGRQAHRQN